MFPRSRLTVRLSSTTRFLILLIAGISLVVIVLNFVGRVRASGASTTVPIQGQADFLRRIPIVANDIVYNPTDQMLYASIPSSAGATGNSLVPINPITGEVGSAVFVGSEPGKLAMSDDGHTIYTFLEGAFALRKFDTVTQTPGQQFGLGADNFFGLYRANDFVVAPGNPNVVAVARYYLGVSPPEGGVAIFDNGVQRPTTTPGHIVGANFLAFSNSETKLFGAGDQPLQTMTVSDSGVTISVNTSFNVGQQIKFANGRVYSSTGQVVDPDTGTLLGTFPSTFSPAFVPDPASARAFFVVRDFASGTFTLKAYDINTFVLTGTFSFSATGDPTTLLRWGSNGLALRTTTGEVHLIQTSLIPSPDPIPTPTPTPTATASPTPTPAIPTFVREVPLPVNDLLFNSQNQLLYATVPSLVGPGGNSVTQINPSTGQLGTSLFVGSEPRRLVAADDNQTMYVTLNGAGAVRRLDSALTTAGLQFSLGTSSFDGPFIPDDISVMPGSPGTVAVSKVNGGTTVYDDGVARLQGGNGGQVDFGSPTRLYISSGGSALKMDVDLGGLTQVGSSFTATNGNTELVNGLLYFAGGSVVDPETGEIKGRFSSSSFSSENAVAVDPALGKVFFLRSGNNLTLEAYDINTFRLLGSQILTGISLPSFGFTMKLVRWGNNGLAFNGFNKIYLVQSALVSNSDPIPSPTPTPSPTPSPSPAYIPTLLRTVNVPANDLAIRKDTQTLYVSVPSVGGAIGNSITAINPQTAVIGTSVGVGSEPSRIALSDDNQMLYVGLDGSNSVRRVDLTNQTAGLQFPLGTSQFNGPLLVDDMEVAPGQPNVVAISRRKTCCSPRHEGVAIYDNGVMRPTTTQVHTGSNVIEFSAAPTLIYGLNNETTEFGFRKLTVDASGVTQTSNIWNLLSGATDFKFAAGRAYATNGRVIDPDAGTLLGTFNAGGFLVTVDTTLGRAFLLSNNFGFGPVTLSAFDINTFLPLGSVTLPNVSGTLRGLVRWGANGLAFCSVKNFDSNSVSQVYLVQSFLVSDAQPIPSTLQFSASTYTTFETNGNITITVTRMGGVSEAASVNYATSDGTATAGSDYTATSGTLNFAAGEVSKTFTIPILDDDVFEGNETVNLTLSNPAGGPTLGTPATSILTINDSEFTPFLSVAGAVVNEGDSGATPVNVTLTLSNRTTQTVTLNYATVAGTATPGSDYVEASGTVTFNPLEKTKTIKIDVIGDLDAESNETFGVNLTNIDKTSNTTAQASISITDDDAPGFRFSSATYSVGEGEGHATLTVTRKGDTTTSASINFQTVDPTNSVRCDDTTTLPQTAFARCDYATSIDVLSFAPGVTSNSFTIPIIDDGHVESSERVQVNLFGASGASLVSPNSALLTIVDNDLPGAPNPIFDSTFFVRQHYLDFLSREPEPSGLQAWLNVLNNCSDVNNDLTCDRLTVSQSFFGSDEFRLKGFYVFLFYKAALNRLPTYTEIVLDMRQVTGQTPEEVYQKRGAFAQAFVQRNEFNVVYGAMSNSQFVAALLAPYSVATINTTDPQNPDTGNNVTLTQADLVNALNQTSLTRAQVLRAIIQSREITDREFNSAFVAMQYYGYLRRTPEPTGYQAWVNYLGTHPGDFRTMVNGFMNSTEYRLRFGISQ